jgi:hypothetical protein
MAMTPTARGASQSAAEVMELRQGTAVIAGGHVGVQLPDGGAADILRGAGLGDTEGAIGLGGRSRRL